MEPHNEIDRLIAYAKLDRELNRFLALLEEIPEDLKRDADALKEELENIAALQTDLGNWEAEKQTLESDQITDADKRSERETRLNSIQNMREHQAAVKEIEEAKRRVKSREETLASLVERINGARAELELLLVKQTELEQRVNDRTQTLTQERETLQREIESMRRERDAAALLVSPTLLAKHGHISKLRQPAIACIQNGVCEECYMQLPPQQYIELQRSHSFMICPSCQRLIYIESVHQ